MATTRSGIGGIAGNDGEDFVIFGTERTGTDEGTGTGTDEGTGTDGGSGTNDIGSGKPRTRNNGTRKAKAEDPKEDTIILEVVEAGNEPEGEPKKRRGRPKGYSPKANKEAEELAPLVLMLFEALAVQALGPLAGFTPEERAMITPPLTRILARMDRGRLEKMQTYSDPLLLAFGLIMWGTRVASLKALENKTRREAQANPVPNPVERPSPTTPYSGGLGPLEEYISGV